METLPDCAGFLILYPFIKSLDQLIVLKKILLILFLVLLIVGGYCAWMIAGPTVHAPEKKYFYIPTGSSYASVRQKLLNQQIVSSPFWFDKTAKYAAFDEGVRAGRYEITEGMSNINLVRLLKAGRQSAVNLVITKLRTIDDLAGKISSNLEADSVETASFLYSNDSLAKFGVDTNTVMTLVIPNSYRFYWNTNVASVLKKLKNEKEKFWNDERKSQARNLGLTNSEVYTLASIVEEETNKADDKGKIASVYYNRINKGMRLAADPTIKFAMKNFGLKRIYHKYLTYPSPYNTYQNAGLPPGPICTPSIKTIDAVLHMPSTTYIFFVARSDFSGYSDFSDDYRQHLVYAKSYQQALDSLIKARQASQ